MATRTATTGITTKNLSVNRRVRGGGSEDGEMI